MTRVLFDNASVLDTEGGTLVPDQLVLVDNTRIVEVGASSGAKPAADRTIDLRGRVLMPGLIDCHVHVTAATANFAETVEWSPLYLGARAGEIMRGMLQRGFTTVRDAAGGDFGLARAVEEGLIDGPRLIFGGRGLSQTGGHGDGRSRGRTALEPGYSYTEGTVICDGVPEVRRAVREEIKRGAHHIKLMLSGGVASRPTGSTARSFPPTRFARRSTRPRPPTSMCSRTRTPLARSTAAWSAGCGPSNTAT